jgi:hypothetical protein
MEVRMDMKAGAHWRTVQELGSGWAVVEMWANGEDIPGCVFPEPWDMDMLRFGTREEALRRARLLAVDDGMPFVG